MNPELPAGVWVPHRLLMGHTIGLLPALPADAGKHCALVGVALGGPVFSPVSGMIRFGLLVLVFGESI